MDEPTSGLDGHAAAVVMRVTRAVANMQRTIVWCAAGPLRCLRPPMVLPANRASCWLAGCLEGGWRPTPICSHTHTSPTHPSSLQHHPPAQRRDLFQLRSAVPAADGRAHDVLWGAGCAAAGCLLGACQGCWATAGRLLGAFWGPAGPASCAARTAPPGKRCCHARTSCRRRLTPAPPHAAPACRLRVGQPHLLLHLARRARYPAGREPRQLDAGCGGRVGGGQGRGGRQLRGGLQGTRLCIALLCVVLSCACVCEGWLLGAPF